MSEAVNVTRSLIWIPQWWLGLVLIAVFWPLNWVLPGMRTAYFSPLAGVHPGFEYE